MPHHAVLSVILESFCHVVYCPVSSFSMRFGLFAARNTRRPISTGITSACSPCQDEKRSPHSADIVLKFVLISDQQSAHVIGEGGRMTEADGDQYQHHQPPNTRNNE